MTNINTFQGKVGVGTNTPGLPLETYTGNGANYGLRLRRGAGAAFTDLGHLSTPGTEGLAFNVSDGSSTTQEVMRVTGIGRVGIGTNAPDNVLHIYNNADNVGYVVENNARTFTMGLRGDTSDVFAIVDDTAQAFRMTVQTNGNVGIGTAASDNRLHIYNNADNVGYVVENNARTFTMGIRGDTSDAFAITDDTAGAFRMSITSDGYVGIGPSLATQGLMVDGNNEANFATWSDASYGGCILVKDTGGGVGNGAGILFGANQGSHFAGIKSSVIDGTANSKGNLGIFVRNGTSDSSLALAAVFEYTGHVGIGTTNPSVLLDVAAQHGDIANPMVHFRANRDGNSNGDGNVLKLTTGNNRSDVEILQVDSNNGTRLVVKANGETGINTNNPSEALTVDGTVRLGSGSQNIYMGGNKTGPFLRLNDDAWLGDPQASIIDILNNAGNQWGTLRGTFSNQSTITSKKGVNKLTDDYLETLYNDTISTDLYSFYYKNEEIGYNKPKLGVIIEYSPEYLSSRDGSSLYPTQQIAMIHGACKVLDKNIKAVASDVKNHLDFTGQHRTFISNVALSDYELYEGLIVSADTNTYYDNSIQINEAIPIVSICKKTMDKACFGVVSTKEDTNDYSYNVYITREDGDVRAKINAIGEGGIWVSNINGNLESGDYITTSNTLPGYGQKQDDDILHNYTVAKITTDCDFSDTPIRQKRIKKKFADVTYYIKDIEQDVDKKVYDNWDPSKREIKTQECYCKTVVTTSDEPLEDATKLYADNVIGKYITFDEYDELIDEDKIVYTDFVYQKEIVKTLTCFQWENALKVVKGEYEKATNTFYSVTVRIETKTPHEGYDTEVRNELINDLDEHGQLQWEDDPSGDTKTAYKIRYLDTNGVETDEANTVHTAAFVGCTYHCG